MVRSLAIFTVTLSLLLCSGQVYSGSPLVFPVLEEELATECACASYGQPCPKGYGAGQGHGHIKKSCPLVGHRHRVGNLGLPLGNGVAQLSDHGVAYRLGAGGPCPLKAGRHQVGDVPGQMVVVQIQGQTVVVPGQPGAAQGQMVVVPGQIVRIVPGQPGQILVLVQDPTGATQGQPVVIPGQPGAAPGQTLVLPGQIVRAVPGLPGRMVIRIQDPSGATPGHTVAMPDQPGAVPGQIVSVPGQIVGVAHGQVIVHIPDPTGATSGQTIALPGQPGAVPGQMVSVPGRIEQIMPGVVQQRTPLEQQPTGGFFGGMLRPRQYQPDQPVGGYGFAQFASDQGAGAQGYAYAYGYPVPTQERIVYVPYAVPPPIHVERPGRMPIPIMPLPQLARRLLGDTATYEYPEMPLHLYTTRGPRDFYAPTPPGIGE